MAHQAIIETFTSDEEMDYWVTGDDTIELRGYIDQIEGTKKVPGGRGLNQSMTSLFKVVVNNGSRYRVRVLFWGQKATEFSSSLRDKSIITITRARTSEVNRRFSNPTELLAPLELSITNASQVTIENKLFQEDAPNTPPTTVTLIDAPNTLGRLIVCGWLKLPFAPVVSYGATYGSGVIINDKYKLRMQVVDYRTPITLKKGVYIKVLCESALDNSGSCILNVRASEDISLDVTHPPLTDVAMRKLGIITATQRKAEDDEESVSNPTLIATLT